MFRRLLKRASPGLQLVPAIAATSLLAALACGRQAARPESTAALERRQREERET
jgi:hypothetical protein